MPLLRPINLPIHVVPQSLGVLGLGLYVTFFRRPPFGSTGKEIFVPHPTSRRIADTASLLGVVASALMMPYYLNSYMPIEENQWLHVSVPVRLGISTVLGSLILIHGKAGLSEEGFWEYLGLAVFDGFGAIVLGLQLGRFDGMVPGSEKWL